MRRFAQLADGPTRPSTRATPSWAERCLYCVNRLLCQARVTHLVVRGGGPVVSEPLKLVLKLVLKLELKL